MQTFRKYLNRHFPSLGEVVRVDSVDVKIASEVRVHAGTRH